MFPTATALSVDDVAKKQLESLARSGITPQRVAQKCRVILLAQEGMSNHSIAKQLGLSRPTVIAARAAFRYSASPGREIQIVQRSAV
jgi:DNA-binding NarL/FixJ family response regulator